MRTTFSALALALATLATEAAAQQDLGYISQPYDVAVEDDLAARQVIARLNHALDAGDYALYASFFAADAEFISDFGSATGPERIAASLEASRPFITNRRHVAANAVINRDGARLVVTTYLVVFERAASLDFVGSSVNVDTLEERDGSWKVVRHDSTLDPATMAFIEDLMQDGSE